jgi:sarcosine oxidase subunit beta
VADRRARRLPPDCDVLIVGGGIMGLSAAYWTSGSALRVTLVDARRIGFGASGRNAGLMLAGASELEAPHHLLSVLAHEGIDAEYRQTGHLALAASDDILDRMRAEVARRSPDAPPLRVLTRHECEDLLRTRIGNGLRGGRWYPGGAVVHPGRLLQGLAAAAARRGTHIAETTAVLTIRPAAGDAADVETSRGRIRARHVVIAAQAATGALVPELAAALTPVRARMVATRPIRPVFAPAMAIDWGTLYWRQTSSGTIVLGGRMESPLSSVLAAAFPDLPPLRAARRWTGVMDQTADGRPIVGRVPRESSQWVVAGFGGHGLPPALGVGRALAAAIATGSVPPALDRFDPCRFDPPRATRHAVMEAM